MRLGGKVALISGGARGMGAAEARMFAREGARVVLGDILDKEGAEVEADIKARGGDALYLRLDVTSEADWARAVAAAASRFGKLDVLVNNAGVCVGFRIEDTTAEAWDRVMDINAKGVFLGTKAAIPAMRRAGGGAIVNISSGAGRSYSLTGIQAYEYVELYHMGALPEVDIFWSTFYAMTGFHGSHVFVGIAAFLFILLGSLAGNVHRMLVKVAGIYWHFVDVIWFFVASQVYFW